MKKISKILVLLLVGIMILTACGSTDNQVIGNDNIENIDTNEVKEDIEDTVYKIGISQLTEHPALDDARRGFEDGLKELGVNVEIDYKNAQGDIANTVSIAQKFVSDGVDLIFAIATPAAQSAKQASTEIPIIFSAVTDPVQAELVDSMEVPGGNITGTSDASPMDRQLQLFKDLDSNIKSIGIIFNTSEANSHVQVEMAKEIGKEIGLEIVEVGISTINDIPQAVDSIVKKVDGIYTITDNMVASAINVVSEKAIENKIITVGAEDFHVNGGILITDGISYYELGKQSARMAKEVLVDKKDIANLPAEVSTNTEKAYNKNTLNALGLDENNAVFKDAKAID